MKKITLLAATILALAMCATAQQVVDFDQLPATAIPQPVPTGYSGMQWEGIDFVAAPLYTDVNKYIAADGAINSGRGFFTGNHAMMAFGGGPLCFHDYGAPVADGATDKHICDASISAWQKGVFRVTSAVVSAGWNDGDFITVTAYRNGAQVGPSVRYGLTTTARSLNFANNNWGAITELVIHPGPRGSFVIYTISLN